MWWSTPFFNGTFWVWDEYQMYCKSLVLMQRWYRLLTGFASYMWVLHNLPVPEAITSYVTLLLHSFQSLQLTTSHEHYHYFRTVPVLEILIQTLRIFPILHQQCMKTINEYENVRLMHILWPTVLCIARKVLPFLFNFWMKKLRKFTRSIFERVRFPGCKVSTCSQWL